MKNIDSQIGNEYNRIRIGVGSPLSHKDTINFVLSRFSKQELDVLEPKLEFISSSINELIKKDIAHYSNLVGQENTK